MTDPKRNIKIVIEYDGKGFFGWQVQKDKRTVQGEIESALETIFNKKIRIKGSGRTDAGVHAIGQVANFFIDKNIPLEKLQKSLNGITGKDVYIKSIQKVPLNFDARFSAKSRIYQYRCVLGKSPIRRNYTLEILYPLNIEHIIEAIPLFIGKKDFTHLSMKDKGTSEVKKFNLRIKKDEIIFTIEANRFLRRMVRGIIGVMIDIGREKITIKDIEKILTGKIRCKNAPPQGLYLMKVKYK